MNTNDKFAPQAIIVQSRMNKGWIRANLGIARESIDNFFVNAFERGMMTQIHEDDNYVDLVAAFNEADLEKKYA